MEQIGSLVLIDHLADTIEDHSCILVFILRVVHFLDLYIKKSDPSLHQLFEAFHHSTQITGHLQL